MITPSMKWLTLLLFTTLPAVGAEIIVRDAKELRVALRDVADGQTLKIATGNYPGGNSVSGIEDLTIDALDPEQPPIFQGGKSGWHFSRCPRLTLRHLRVSGQSINGINLDDGGQRDLPIGGITLEHLEVSDIGPVGNYDGIKCSGLEKLTIRECAITGWGGQGIDFVGCHRSLVTNCRFIGKPGFSAHSGVQIKGGSSEITVEKCRFVDAGQRPFNVGGSTGLAFFRPSDAKHEAARIVVRENVIEGSQCAAAFVGVDGAEFTGNTVLFPTHWIFRILQESREPRFDPCRNVLVKSNRFIFRRAQVRTDINISDGTAPETFRFEKNHWFAEDLPKKSKPALPTEETNGTYGTDPR